MKLFIKTATITLVSAICVSGAFASELPKKVTQDIKTNIQEDVQSNQLHSQDIDQQKTQLQKQAQNMPQEDMEIDLTQSNIKQIQQKLKEGGFSLDIDGEMGPDTHAALRAFQKQESLPVTGKINRETVARLGLNF